MNRFFFILFLTPFLSSGQSAPPDWKTMDPSMLLIDFIQNEGYDYLGFDEESKGSLSDRFQTIVHYAPANSAVIRKNPSLIIPLVIVNREPIGTLEMLERISLLDIQEITLNKPSDTTMAIYGMRGQYGLIIVTLKKRKWNYLRKDLDWPHHTLPDDYTIKNARGNINTSLAQLKDSLGLSNKEIRLRNYELTPCRLKPNGAYTPPRESSCFYYEHRSVTVGNNHPTIFFVDDNGEIIERRVDWQLVVH